MGAYEALLKAGAIREGHFVLSLRRHSARYINKDALYPHTHATSSLCQELARRFIDLDVQVVVGPAMGGIILSTYTANWLELFNVCKKPNEKPPEILAAYAEKVGKDEDGDVFAFRRGYEQLIPDRRVLAVEDLTSTGKSVRKIVNLVRSLGGLIVGVGVLANRGGVTIEQVGSPDRFCALAEIPIEDFAAEACPMCHGPNPVPVNTDLGHGKAFLQSRGFI